MNRVYKRFGDFYLRAGSYLKERFVDTMIEMPVGKIRYEYGFGFESLYHPYYEALKLDDIDKAKRLLYDFVLSFRSQIECYPPDQALTVQAWKFYDRKITNYLSQGSPETHFLPRPDESLEDYLESKVGQIYKLKESISSKGYDSALFNSSPIRGVMVDDRFLVLGGQHRCLVLNFLGYKNIPVQHKTKYINIPAVMDSSDVRGLPLVKRALISNASASVVLKRISTGIKKEQASSLGFPFSESYL